jgi:hypothetical protein
MFSVSHFLIYNLVSFTSFSESICQNWYKNQSTYCKCKATMNKMKYSFIYLTGSQLKILNLKPSSLLGICIWRQSYL